MAGRSLMDWINDSIKIENGDLISKEEFKRIRNHGTEQELQDALRIMETAGGYDNLA